MFDNTEDPIQNRMVEILKLVTKLKSDDGSDEDWAKFYANCLEDTAFLMEMVVQYQKMISKMSAKLDKKIVQNIITEVVSEVDWE